MKLPALASLTAASLLVSGVSAQWERLQHLQQMLMNPGSADEVPVLEPRTVYPVTVSNWRTLLQHTDVDWLVLFTTGPEGCPGCVIYEQAFNDAVALIQNGKEQTDVYFARVDCDDQALLCSVFSSWGSRVYHITHALQPSKAFPGMTERNTLLRAVPFHRPGTETEAPEPAGAEEEATKDAKDKKRPPPPPDAHWLAEVLREERWRELAQWTGYGQPFDGMFKEVVFSWWWLVNLFSGVPPMAMMIGIGLLSRFVTSRYKGQAYAPKRREGAAAAAAGGAAAAARKDQ